MAPDLDEVSKERTQRKKRRRLGWGKGGRYQMEEDSSALAPGGLPGRDVSKKGTGSGSPQRHHVVLSPPQTPHPISTLGPGFPDLLLGPQTLSHKCQHDGPCARLPRKQSASGMLCCAVGTKSGLPWWLHGKEPTCQCRRCQRSRFDPWMQKITWRREWLPTPVFLPGKFHGQRSLAGYSPWG